MGIVDEILAKQIEAHLLTIARLELRVETLEREASEAAQKKLKQSRSKNAHRNKEASEVVQIPGSDTSVSAPRNLTDTSNGSVNGGLGVTPPLQREGVTPPTPTPESTYEEYSTLLADLPAESNGFEDEGESFAGFGDFTLGDFADEIESEADDNYATKSEHFDDSANKAIALRMERTIAKSANCEILQTVETGSSENLRVVAKSEISPLLVQDGLHVPFARDWHYWPDVVTLRSRLRGQEELQLTRLLDEVLAVVHPDAIEAFNALAKYLLKAPLPGSLLFAIQDEITKGAVWPAVVVAIRRASIEKKVGLSGVLSRFVADAMQMPGIVPQKKPEPSPLREGVVVPPVIRTESGAVDWRAGMAPKTPPPLKH